jgi:uncharacterized protein YraI
MFMKSKALAAAAIVALGTGGALAQTTATATVDLNLRTGPGPIYQIVEVIPAEGEASVVGCVDTASWCELTYNGVTGWSYAPYLALSGEQVPLSESPSVSSLTVVEFDDQSGEAALVGTGLGAAVGALVAGPIGAVAGGLLAGATAGSAVEPEVRVYATENPVEPVILEGEVAVGAVVPQTVTAFSVPDYTAYEYLNVNGNLVVIDANTRAIVDVIR